jgi:hypothetical protein
MKFVRARLAEVREPMALSFFCLHALPLRLKRGLPNSHDTVVLPGRENCLETARRKARQRWILM